MERMNFRSRGGGEKWTYVGAAVSFHEAVWAGTARIALRAAWITNAGIIAGTAVGAELWVGAKGINAGGSETLSGSGDESITTLTNMEESAGNVGTGENTTGEGCRQEYGGEGEWMHC